MFSLCAIVIRLSLSRFGNAKRQTKSHPPAKHRTQTTLLQRRQPTVLHQLLRRAALPPQRRMTARDQLPCRAVHRAAHLVFTQPPTSMIVEMTATNMTPSRTVYSTSAAPFSSSLSFLISCDT